MHRHFEDHINLKKLILEKRPKVVVECGAGNGDLTRKLATLLDVYEFELYVISDYPVEGLDSRIKWITGISYKALERFKDSEIDLCIIDTDHNYWTLSQELSVLRHRVKEGGLIAMHDVDTFYHDTGMAMGYSNGEVYPKEEIEGMSPLGSLGDALIEFLHKRNTEYKLLSYSDKSNGAAVIQRKTQPVFQILAPGNGAVFVR